MKKMTSILLAAVLLVTLCVGCGQAPVEPSGIFYDATDINPAETMMTVDGNEIPAERYLYWIMNNCSSLANSLIDYDTNFPGELDMFFNEDKSINWDANFTGDQTLNQVVRTRAENRMKYDAVIENLAKELDITLTDDDKAAMESDRTYIVDQLGSEEAFETYLAQTGRSRETYDTMSSVSYLYYHLMEKVAEEGSPLYLDPAEYDQYATYADHILLATIDLTTQASIGADAILEKQNLAKELAAELQELEGDALLKRFDELADKYSEDTGRASNPNGYIYAPGTMVASFEDAASALEPGQVSGVVNSEYGYHIILRKDLAEGLAADPSQLPVITSTHLETVLQEKVDSCNVVYADTLEAFVPGTFFASYTKLLEQMSAEGGSEENTEAAE